MTTNRTADVLGSKALWQAPRTELTILVNVREVRSAWGRIDYQIVPVGGSGRQWVDATSVRVLPTA